MDSRLQLPSDLVDEARNRGFRTTTVGEIISERFTNGRGDKTDPHTILTNGRVSRRQYLTDALVDGLREIAF
jgi:hypothetical protein